MTDFIDEVMSSFEGKEYLSFVMEIFHDDRIEFSNLSSSYSYNDIYNQSNTNVVLTTDLSYLTESF